jgi:hypothetical protein
MEPETGKLKGGWEPSGDKSLEASPPIKKKRKKTGGRGC